MEKLREKNKEGLRRNVQVILLGSSLAGKTSLIMRYVNNDFYSNYTTTLGNFGCDVVRS